MTPPTKSNTPRTDAEANGNQVVLASFARQLEKELQQAIRREVLEKCVEAINDIFRPETKCADYHDIYGHLMGYSFDPNSVIHNRLQEALTLAQQELERTK